MRIRAQIDMRGEAAAGPDLRVDGEVITWAELGTLLESYEGWGLRIEITEAGRSSAPAHRP
jgi:hypothetical protein